MIQHAGEVLNHRKLGEDYHALTIVAPEIAEEARPGQFVNLRPAGDRAFILRRPFSIYRVHRRGAVTATIEVVFDVRGPGTAWLGSLRRHDPIDVVGPVGRGFSIPTRQHSCLLVGGGVGATPLFFLGDELLAAGKRVDILWGASTASRLVNTIEAKRLGATAVFLTEDESEGERGIVTDRLPGVIERCGTEVIYACGPHGMLAAVTRLAVQHQVPVQVAMEELMGCGIGICMTCVTPVYNREGTEVNHLRTCMEGPVFNGARIAWERYGSHPVEGPAAPAGN